MIKKISLSIIFSLFLISMSGCGTIKKGFSSQKKNNNDEFLVEKKSPLLMPPDYGELPVPNSESTSKNKNDEKIKKLLTKTDDSKTSSNNSKDKSSNFEKTLLEKIKDN
tara:strand:- start:126 stop:452 length:327 start_codon:yes stop_codon:yes gene_type:complete